jgi:hypothetical protein
MSFRVIDGAMSEDLLSKDAEPKSTSDLAEEEKLAAFILKLYLPEAGLTVEQARGGVHAHPQESLDIYATQRGSFLCRELEGIGIYLRLCDPSIGVGRPAFLNLGLPNLLLARHPQLAPLNPNKHQYMIFG